MRELRRIAICLFTLLLLAVAVMAADTEEIGRNYVAYESLNLLSGETLGAETATDTSAMEQSVMSAIRSGATEATFVCPYTVDDTGKWDNDLMDEFCRIIFDHAEECFNVESRLGMSYNPDTGMVTIFITYSSSMDKQAYTAAVDKAYASCVTENMTPLEKVAACYSWVVANCQYDPYICRGSAVTAADGVVYGDDPDVYTSYGVFVKHNAVCQGYALAMDVLLDRAGVPDVVTTGKVSGGGHAWNRVELDGVWYHVDSTWGDGISASVGDIPGQVSYDFLLLSDAEIKKQDHLSWDEADAYPCPSSYPTSADEFWKNSDQPVFLRGGKLYYIANANYLYDNLYEVPVGKSFSVSDSKLVSRISNVYSSLILGGSLYFSTDGYTVSSLSLKSGEFGSVVLPKEAAAKCGLRLNVDDRTLELVNNWAVLSSAVLVETTDKTQAAYFSWSPALTTTNASGASVSLTTATAAEAASSRVLAVFCDASGRMLSVAALDAAAEGTELSCVLPALPAGCASVRLYALDSGNWTAISACAEIRTEQ